MSTYVELCYCCGIEPIKSGSRWSVFFCDECKDCVLSFNRRSGQWIIPIGRHSLMHGASLGAGEDARLFTGQLRGLGDAIGHLGEWASDRVWRNVMSLSVSLYLDFDPDDRTEGIDLASYLNAARECGLEKQKLVAFEGLRRHFAVEE